MFLEICGIFKDSKIELAVYQHNGVKGKRIFPLFPREQPPTALRCVSHSAPSSRAEYVVSVCYKGLTERQKSLFLR